MTDRHSSPAAHVLAAFGLSDTEGIRSAPRGWDGGVILGSIVLSPVADNARSTWSARVRDTLTPAHVRLARPYRSRDGRTVVGGWKADRWEPGELQSRPDETIAASLRLHSALKNEHRPRFLTGQPTEPWNDVDHFTMADRAAFHPSGLDLLADHLSVGTALDGGFRSDIERGIALYDRLACYRTEVMAPQQVVHGDLFVNTLFSSGQDPLVTDLVPYWHSPSWAAGVVAIDALTWASSDASLLRRWSHLTEWPQQLLRAYLFRLGVHLIHDHASPRSFQGLLTAGLQVRDLLEGRL